MSIEQANDRGDYRESHATEGYGEHYVKTYQEGYYAVQWEQLEKPILRNLFEEQKKRGAESYLDFACGTGRIISVGEKFFPKTVGVDISAEMLSEAKKICQSAELIQRDITENPISGSFDVISAFRFFLNAQDKLSSEVLKQLHKHLADDGRLIVNVHVNKSSPLGLAYGFRNMIKRQKIANTKGSGEFIKMLADHGYTVEKQIWYSFLPRIGWRFGSQYQSLLKPFDILSKLPLIRRMSQSFILVCKKS